MILAVYEGLRWLGERRNDQALLRAAHAVDHAVTDLVQAGSPLTYDLVGEDRASPMSAVGDNIRSRLRSLLS